jgi:hypothetical protein
MVIVYTQEIVCDVSKSESLRYLEMGYHDLKFLECQGFISLEMVRGTVVERKLVPWCNT